MIAFVFFVIFSSIDFGSMLNVSNSMSAKTGFAPCINMGLAVAIKVKGVVITSSSFPMPATWSEVCNPAVPLLSRTACLVPQISASFSSASATFGPCAISPESITSSTAFFSSLPINGLDIGIILGYLIESYIFCMLFYSQFFGRNSIQIAFAMQDCHKPMSWAAHFLSQQTQLQPLQTHLLQRQAV